MYKVPGKRQKTIENTAVIVSGTTMNKYWGCEVSLQVTGVILPPSTASGRSKKAVFTIGKK